MENGSRPSIRIFSTCAQSSAVPRESYLQQVVDVARWSEAAGCTAILVYTDNSLVDPWLVAQLVIQSTRRLSPLVAVQPAYMHPYAVAKMVASLGHLHGRRVYLNMVAGGFRNDLLALGDDTPHDRRYARLVEYTTIIQRLLCGSEPVTFAGEFYQVDKLKMTPPLDPDLAPTILISGSSDSRLAAARQLGATAVQYPRPARDTESDPPPDDLDVGVRVGVVARPTKEEAWAVANERFPGDRKGQLAHQLAMKISDSHWHRQLSEMAREVGSVQGCYWMWPFENYKTFCPYLVGSYEQVAEEVLRYLGVGYRTFILDIPPNREELCHVQAVFERASGAACGGVPRAAQGQGQPANGRAPWSAAGPGSRAA